MAERVFLNHPSIPLGCHVVFYDHWSVWMKDIEASKTSSVSISVRKGCLVFGKFQFLMQKRLKALTSQLSQPFRNQNELISFTGLSVMSGDGVKEKYLPNAIPCNKLLRLMHFANAMNQFYQQKLNKGTRLFFNMAAWNQIDGTEKATQFDHCSMFSIFPFFGAAVVAECSSKLDFMF